MRIKLPYRLLLATGALAVAGLLAQPGPSQAAADSTCETVVPVSTKSGSNLDSFTPTRSGVSYTPASGALGLIKSTAFSPASSLGISDSFVLSCAGDFDGDGWTDFVTTGDSADFDIRWYKNQTYQNPAPGCTVGGTAASPDPGCASPWTPRSSTRTAKFVRQPTFDYRTNNSSACGSDGCPIRGGMSCADLNGDGKQDFVIITCQVTSGNECTSPDAKIYLNTGTGNRFSTASSYKYNALGTTSTTGFGKVSWSHQFAIDDYNGDGRKDLIWGGATNSSTGSTMTTNGGDLVYFAGQNTTPFRFSSTATTIEANAGFNYRGPTVVAFANFSPSSATKQLLISGPSTLNVELHPIPYSASNKSVITNWVPNSSLGVPSLGGATFALVADYNLDGLPDVIMGSDNFNYPTINGAAAGTQHGGAVAMFFKNNGTTTPFTGVTPQVLSTHDDAPSSSHSVAGQRFDFDEGWVMDYDNDPDHTPDAVVADGNQSATFFLLPIRMSSSYNACGTVTSDAVALDSSLEDAELTITSARITPTATIPSGTSIKWEGSNDNGATWVNAVSCSVAPTTDYCVTFSTSVGSQVRWRATLYSNTSQSCAAAVGSTTPSLTAVGISYNYMVADSHYRSGPVAKDGLIYLGSFKEPGERGRFVAINDANTLTLAWDASTKLDAMADSSRNIYTASSTNALLSLTTANASNSTVQTTLGAAGNSATTSTIISWLRSARFGLTGTKQRLGGIENSTAAILDAPKEPYFYSFTATTATEKALIDTYVTANSTRQNLVLVGAKDGMLHAFYTNPTNASDSKNGTEAWAFVPYDVAQPLLTDCTLASTASPQVCASTNGAGVPSAYVDASPTLATAKIGSAYKTVAVMGEANGGRYIFALDVTSTIDSTTGAVVGPTPLWTYTDTNMGLTFSKPVVVRTKIATVERWLAVFASGSKTGSDVGDSVYAVDMTTGTLVWQFNLGDTNTYISTDIAAADTDDTAEAGSPTKDGYIDRLFFGDSKGRIWKLDPSNGAIVSSTTTSGISGKSALFSTQYTSSTFNVINAQRGIAGSIAIAEGNATTTDPATGKLNKRLEVYFGTGGTDESADNVQNQFFAIYADTGEIRASVTPAVGVRFYGGVSINDSGQLIFGTGTNTGTTVGLCSSSTGSIQAVDANTLTVTFTIPTSARISAPIFSGGGAVYTVDTAGQVRTSATPVAASNGSGGGTFASDAGMSLVGWKQIDL
jgi:type IV pilus assembly protein PilY1